jgi:hypothetical protein
LALGAGGEGRGGTATRRLAVSDFNFGGDGAHFRYGNGLRHGSFLSDEGWLACSQHAQGRVGDRRKAPNAQVRKHREKYTSREMEKGPKLAANIPIGHVIKAI